MQAEAEHLVVRDPCDLRGVRYELVEATELSTAIPIGDPRQRVEKMFGSAGVTIDLGDASVRLLETAEQVQLNVGDGPSR